MFSSETVLRHKPCFFALFLGHRVHWFMTSSWGADLNPITYDILTQRIKQLGNLPAMPGILSTLCETLSHKSSQIDVDKVVRQISYDEALSVQCLRLANSALFHQRGDVTSIRDAVLALGLWRIRDLAFSCSLPVMFANVKTSIPKEAFWRHALGTAMVAHGLSEELHAQNPDDIYLAGLLHDIGILVNGILFLEDFHEVLKEAMRSKLPLEQVERNSMGFTHAESGRILAELWRLPVELAEVIEHHDDPLRQQNPSDAILLVHAADLVCLKLNLGYGYEPELGEAGALPRIWETLLPRFPIARAFTEENFTKLLVHLASSAETLAEHVFIPAMTTSPHHASEALR